jgi:hypothetical protein
MFRPKLSHIQAATIIYLFIYLADCTMFPHLPAPIYQLHNLLPPFASVVPVFFH